MNPSMNRKFELARSAVFSPAVLKRMVSGALALGLFSSCQGVDYSSGNSQLESACKDTVRAFDSNSDVQPYLSIDKLPRGKYLPVGSEVYFENTIRVNTNQVSVSAVQFIILPLSDTDFTRTDRTLRCQESASTFTPYSDETTVPHSFVSHNNGSFDMQWLQSNLNYSSMTRSDLTTRNGGKLTNTEASDLNYSFGRYWTGGYHFSRISGDTFAFYGERKVGERILYGKATFKRENLSAGSN